MLSFAPFKYYCAMEMQLFSRMIKSATDPFRCINTLSNSKELSHLIVNCHLEVIVPIMDYGCSSYDATYVCYSLQHVRTVYKLYGFKASKQNTKQCKIIKNSRNRTD